MRGKKRTPGTMLMAGGLLLLAAAFLLTAYNLWDQRRAEKQAAQVLAEIEPMIAEPLAMESENPQEVEVPDYILDPTREMPVVSNDGGDYVGVVEVPVLGLSLPVMSQWSYPNLKIAPCRYSGSAYQGDLILSAHNYRRHFGGLKELNIGDTVLFRDMDGNEFRYAVVEREILDKTAVEEMTAGVWDLTLFTCTLGGEARVTVRCEEAERE